MTDTRVGMSGRLDSWKAIADYLGRDVATVRRWEKTLGLPVRRVGRGHSVFAYVSEIDAWLTTSPGTAATDNGNGDPAANGNGTSSWWRTRRVKAGAAAILFVAVAGAVVIGGWIRSHADEAGLRAVAAIDGIALVDADGVERWRHRVPATERIDFPHRQPAMVGEGRDRGILGAFSDRVLPGDVTAGGQLVWLTNAGRLARTFSFDDRVTLRAGDVGEPWILTDFRVDPSSDRLRIAVVGRHFRSWPSLITVLDDRWKRQGTFVNAGWVEWIEWMAPNRLLIAGFANERDGGMIALLDADALDGQSPTAPDGRFACPECGAGRPVRYLVFPRSEVNRAAAAPFNRVTLERAGDRIIAHTLELPIDTPLRNADATYELTRALEVLGSSYSDRYWEIHRALEVEGKITHTRESCPDRDGPPTAQLWEPNVGWRTLNLKH